MKNNARIFNFKKILACGLIVSFAITVASCEPLRKKFIRKKKASEQASEEIPILEPIDYPKITHTVEDIYKHHYSIWQVWQREIVNDIQNSSNRKKQLYDVEQISSQLGELNGLFLTGEKREELGRILKRIQKVQDDLNQPDPFQDRTAIRLELESIGKEIRERYKFMYVKDNLIKDVPGDSAY